jgi:hypothetical protein
VMLVRISFVVDCFVPLIQSAAPKTAPAMHQLGPSSFGAWTISSRALIQLQREE